MQIYLNGTSLQVNTFGSPAQPAIVFIHGFPFDSSMWDDQVALFQKRYFVVTYDHRGHGKSGVGDGQYPFELLVDDFFAILSHLRIEKAIVCGLSMGGYIALRAVERDPQRISGLVLCDTRSEADSNDAKLKRAAGIRTIKLQGLPEFADGFLKALFPPESFMLRKNVIDKIRTTINANPPLGVAGTLLALASRTDTTSSLANIRVPTLILVGEKDAITPVSAAETLKEKISGSTLFVIPGAGHLSNLENPIAFNQHLATFLSALRV